VRAHCRSLRCASSVLLSPFVPRGWTALLDAMGRTIAALGEELSNMPEAARPGQVIVMTMTDGKENASQYYTREQIASMVAHQQSVYSWQFMYLGANQDAISVAADMGISASASMNYRANRRAVAATFAASASAVQECLALNLGGLPKSLLFRPEDRIAAMVDGEDEAAGLTDHDEAVTTGAMQGQHAP
jgi:hypothetical protein